MPLAYIRMLNRRTDPGYGQGGIGGGHPDQGLPGYGHPDQGLPDEQPGIDQGLPPFPEQGLPMPPSGTFPPPSVSHPIVPAPPGTPPGAIWPSPGNPPIWSGGVHPRPPHGPGRPDRPDQGLPPGQPDQPDQGLPGGSGGHPDQGLPSGTFWIVAGIPGVGWRYVCVDPSLVAGHPLPPAPEPK